MNHADATALLAVLPGVSSDRAKRFAREVASRIGGRGMGLVLPPLVISLPSWSPDVAGPAPSSTVVPPPVSGTPPAWSPDAPPPPAPPANPFASFVPYAAPAPQAPAPTDASTSSWWPPSKNVLAVGGGALALALLAWAVFRRRGASAAPAPAPIVVVSAPAAVPVKANRPRFIKKGGQRWFVR